MSTACLVDSSREMGLCKDGYLDSIKKLALAKANVDTDVKCNAIQQYYGFHAYEQEALNFGYDSVYKDNEIGNIACSISMLTLIEDNKVYDTF